MSYSKSNTDSDSDNTTSSSLTTEELREKLKHRIPTALTSEKSVVIDAPTSSGKTHTLSATQWIEYAPITGGEPVIHFSGTRKARDEAYAKSQQADGVDPERLFGGEDACPLYGGEYDSDNQEGNKPIKAPDGMEPSEWFKWYCRTKGWPLSAAHHEFSRLCRGDLPCGHSCDALTQWTDIPRDDDGHVQYDVIHATHQMARVPGLIEDCNVIIDELPDFSRNVDTGRVREGVTAYLNEVSDILPLSNSTWENLVTWAAVVSEQDRQECADALEIPDPTWFRDEDNAHALAPGVVEAILRSEEACHDRRRGSIRYEFPDFPSNANTPDYEVLLRLVYDEKYNIKLLHTIPDFSQARCVIGLDAHPTEPKWRANILPQDGL